jgi:starch synthase
MSKSKILYVTQSIAPFLENDGLAELVRKLSQGNNDQENEIRVFMPKFGIVNERRHQLHEVIRLSGMNLIINHSDHPLIIKVASIPQARMQVYFIDNDEFFKRKSMFHDDKGTFHADNEDRALFFCRGVFETVKKLGWSPEIIHCHGWMSAFVPLYLRTFYGNDPHFTDAKSIYTPYNEDLIEPLSANILEKLQADNISELDADVLKIPSVLNLHKLGIKWADAVTCGCDAINPELLSYAKEHNKPTLAFQNEDTIIDSSKEFYNTVLASQIMAD